MSGYGDHGELLQGPIRQLPVDNFFHRESSPSVLLKRHGELLQGPVLSDGLGCSGRIPWKGKSDRMSRKVRGGGLCYGPVVR